LNPGDVFSLFKYGEEVPTPSGGTVETPDIQVSQLIILETTQSTSSAMIFSISSSNLVQIGDRIELVRKQ